MNFWSFLYLQGNRLDFSNQCKVIQMSALGNLKLVPVKKTSQLLPAIQRRNKMTKRIAEQIALCQAQAEGRQLLSTRAKTVRDSETGESKILQVPKRIKAWWWPAENGKLCLSIRYGAKQIALNAKGANAIEVESRDALLETLNIIKNAVLAGELDGQIEAAAGAVKSNFKK